MTTFTCSRWTRRKPQPSQPSSTASTELQGRNRLVRFRNYRAYAKLFPDWTGSRFEIVPGIGHSSSRKFMGEAARRIIFR